MKNKLILMAAVALLVVSVAVNVWLAVRPWPVPTLTVEHDTVWRDIPIVKPVAADSQPTGRIVYIRVPYPVNGGQPPCADDTLPLTADGPTAIPDSIDVPLPIEQKRYDDSLYTAWVSGYRPALDSLRLHLPTVTETVTKTILKPAPLVTFGIHAGAGYGIIHRQPDLYIGIGAQINLWRK